MIESKTIETIKTEINHVELIKEIEALQIWNVLLIFVVVILIIRIGISNE